LGVVLSLTLLAVAVIAFSQQPAGASMASPHQSAGTTSTLMKPPHTPVVPSFQGGTYPVGGHAISLHPSGNNPPGAAFSQQDVIDFLNKYGFAAGPPTDGTPLKILSIQFVTAKQASALMQDETVGRPDSSLVCYVKVKGPFSRAVMRVPIGYDITKDASSGDAVFDTQTDNILVWGLYP
jgi:hypothetical protein